MDLKNLERIARLSPGLGTTHKGGGCAGSLYYRIYPSLYICSTTRPGLDGPADDEDELEVPASGLSHCSDDEEQLEPSWVDADAEGSR